MTIAGSLSLWLVLTYRMSCRQLQWIPLHGVRGNQQVHCHTVLTGAEHEEVSYLQRGTITQTLSTLWTVARQLRQFYCTIPYTDSSYLKQG